VESEGGQVELVTGRSGDLVPPLKELLSRKDRPAGVFAATDPKARKVYSVAAGLGIRIPQDLSVVGYADFPFAQDLVPPLTTVKQDPYQMGRVAAQILLDRIFDRAKSDEPRRIHITPELIVRASTAAAPATK